MTHADAWRSAAPDSLAPLSLGRPLTSALRLLVLLGALSLAVVSVALSSGGTSATSVPLAEPTAAAPIPAAQGGGFYIADMRNNLVLKVDAGGFITTIAGSGTVGSSGDGGPATKAQLSSPTDAVPTADGGVLIAESNLFAGTEGGARVRRVSASGTIATVAGGASSAEASSCPGHTDGVGDGCQATQAILSAPTAAVPLAGGGFLIADWGGNDVREVSPSGVITRVAGSDVSNPTLCPAHTDELGDGCPAVGGPGHGALMQAPTAAIPFNIDGAAVSTPGTGFLVTEEQGCRVRYVNGEGIISTVAGITNTNNSVSCRKNGEAVPATGEASKLKLELPTDARPTAEEGVFLIADGHSCSVYRVNMKTNTYATLSSRRGVRRQRRPGDHGSHPRRLGGFAGDERDGVAGQSDDRRRSADARCGRRHGVPAPAGRHARRLDRDDADHHDHEHAATRHDLDIRGRPRANRASCAQLPCHGSLGRHPADDAQGAQGVEGQAPAEGHALAGVRLQSDGEGHAQRHRHRAGQARGQDDQEEDRARLSASSTCAPASRFPRRWRFPHRRSRRSNTGLPSPRP